MRYKTIYNYLNSSDPELQSLAVGLLLNSKVKNFKSYIYGYKVEYILNYYFDTICKIDNNSIKNAYFTIIRDVIWEFNRLDVTHFQRSIVNSLKSRTYIESFNEREYINACKLMILCDLLKYTKFYRKHCRKQIIIYSSSNIQNSLEEILQGLHHTIVSGFMNFIYVDICLKILKTFKNK